MFEGSCLCGQVSWRVDARLDRLSHCHCSMCRKAHGAPFATFAAAKPSKLAWLSGVNDISHYQASAALTRSFCSHCGSSVPLAVGEQYVGIPVGCMDSELAVTTQEHIFVGSQAPWHRIEDELPRHLEYPGARPAPPRTDGHEARTRSGPPGGSCLCGAVAFSVPGPIEQVYNCHCTRCRKARAAAHTTNAVTRLAGINFLRGEELLRMFKLQGARFFGQTFCTACGSPMPNRDFARDRVSIPLGCMDDDLGVRPRWHIYAASKALWYGWEGELPVYDSSAPTT